MLQVLECLNSMLEYFIFSYHTLTSQRMESMESRNSELISLTVQKVPDPTKTSLQAFFLKSFLVVIVWIFDL